MRRAVGRSLLPLWLAASSGCALRSPPVTRVVSGVEVEGRSIPDEAYAAYARAATLEAAGDDRAALDEYRRALAADSGSAEILARIGAVQCRLAATVQPANQDAASQTFARALTLDAQSHTAWLELARCEARRDHAPAALAAARRAVQSDPDAISSALLVATLCERTGDSSCATTWLDGATTLHPESREAWLALADFSRRHGDAGRAWRAQAGLRALGLTVPVERSTDTTPRASALSAAQQAALRRRVSPSALALELLAAGEASLAREQAEIVLDADPEDADAWIALLGALDLERDDERLAAAIERVPLEGRSPTPLGLRLHGALLARLVGVEARRIWEAALQGSATKPRQTSSSPE